MKQVTDYSSMSFRKRAESLLDALGRQFSIEEQNGRSRIRTPFMYPDGEIIDIFCLPSENGTTVTDLAETINWLSALSLQPNSSEQQNEIIRDICVTHNTNFENERISAVCRSDELLAETIIKVAHACVRVSDLWFGSHYSPC